MPPSTLARKIKSKSVYRSRLTSKAACFRRAGNEPMTEPFSIRHSSIDPSHPERSVPLKSPFVELACAAAETSPATALAVAGSADLVAAFAATDDSSGLIDGLAPGPSSALVGVGLSSVGAIVVGSE